jgi:hypothetical protein
MQGITTEAQRHGEAKKRIYEVRMMDGELKAVVFIGDVQHPFLIVLSVSLCLCG